MCVCVRVLWVWSALTHTRTHIRTPSDRVASINKHGRGEERGVQEGRDTRHRRIATAWQAHAMYYTQTCVSSGLKHTHARLTQWLTWGTATDRGSHRPSPPPPLSLSLTHLLPAWLLRPILSGCHPAPVLERACQGSPGGLCVSCVNPEGNPLIQSVSTAPLSLSLSRSRSLSLSPGNYKRVLQVVCLLCRAVPAGTSSRLSHLLRRAGRPTSRCCTRTPSLQWPSTQTLPNLRTTSAVGELTHTHTHTLDTLSLCCCYSSPRNIHLSILHRARSACTRPTLTHTHGARTRTHDVILTQQGQRRHLAKRVLPRWVWRQKLVVESGKRR